MTARKGPRAPRPNDTPPPARDGIADTGRAFWDRPAGAFVLACGLLLLAVAILYRDLIFAGKVFWAPDSMSAQSLVTAGKNLQAREGYPLWNPYLFSGMPSFGSLVFTPYVYPVNFVLGIFVRYLFFPEYSWLLFHTFLTGVATFLLLRERGARLAAALPAGVLMMWMPNLVAIGANGHGSQACAVAYLPLALYFWDRLWRGKGLVFNAAALSITLGLSMLRGHLQVSYYTYGLVGLHAFFFGLMRIVDGARGRADDASPLPAALRARLGAGSPARRALTDVACAWVVLALAVGLSVMMSAVLYLPVTDYAKHSIRGASIAGGLDYSYATMWSLHPSEMITFLVPHAFGFGKELYLGHMPFTDYPNYLGVIVFAMALGAALGVRTRWVRFLSIVWVVATLISFGNFFPVLYGPLFKLLPFFNKFRVPVMILIVQQLATIVMFGVGLDAVLGAPRERIKTLATRALIAAAVVFGAAVLSHGYFSGSGFATAAAPHVHATRDPDQQRMVAEMAGQFLARDIFQLALILLLGALAVFAYVRRNLNAALFSSLVLLLGAVDYYRVDRFILHPEVFLKHDGYRILHDKRETERFKTPDEMIGFLQKQPQPFRVLPVDGPQTASAADGSPPPISFELQGLFATNRFMVFDIGSVGGYHPAKLQDYEEFIRALKFSMENGRLDLASMMNARYLVAGVRLADHPSLKAVWVGRDYNNEPRAIYENAGVFPRAWIAGAYRVEKPDEELIAMANGEVDLRHTVLLEKKPALEPVSGDSAVVSVGKIAAKESSFSVTLDRPGVLVAGEVYYPDWKATVDGQPAEMLKANHVLRAVALTTGKHEVVFKYDSSVVKEGATVSIVTFMVTLVACLVAALSRRGGTTWKRSS